MMVQPEEVLRPFGAKPLLIEAAKLGVAYSDRRPYAARDGVAVVDISGVLANDPSLFEAIVYGATDYSQVLAEVEQAVADTEVRGILLRINSPGGDSDNAFETAEALARLGQVKPIWAVADNAVFSAAYLLACAAERVYVPEFTGGVGSIGVYAAHLDWSEYNRKVGLKVTYVAEGEGKTDGNPNEPLSDAALEKLRAEVGRLYDLFVGFVARRRGMSADAIRGLGAALKYGPDAVSAGLADRTGTLRDALSQLTVFTKQRGLTSGPAISTQGEKTTMGEETQQAEVRQPAVDIEALRTKAREQGYAEAREIVELCALAGLPDKAAGLLARQATAAEARQSLLEARAAADATEIRSHVMPDTGTNAKPSLENNPVMQAVERLNKGVI